MPRLRACSPLAIALLAGLLLAAPAAAQQNRLDEAAALNQQVMQLYQQGRYADAVPLAQRALAAFESALGPEHPNVATSLGNLAALSLSLGRYAEAERLNKRALAIREKALGPEHPAVAGSLANLAEAYRALGRYAEAAASMQRALAIREKTLGPQHPNLARSLNNLAALHESQGRYAEAETMHKRALAIWEHSLGLEHPDVAASLSNLASLYFSQGRYAEAEPLHARALAIREKALGPEHPEVATPLINLADVYRVQRRYAEAIQLTQRALAIWEKALGPEHPSFATPLNNLAALYEYQGRYAESESLHKRSLAITEKTLGPEHPSVATSLNNLAVLYYGRRRYAEAVLAIRRAQAIREKALGPAHPDVAAALKNLAELYKAQGRDAEAYATGRQAFAILQDRALASAGQDGPGNDAERQSNRSQFLFFLSVAAVQAGRAPEQRDAIAIDSFAAAQLAGQSSADRALAQASLRFASASEALALIVRERQDAVDRRLTLGKAVVAAASQPPSMRVLAREQALRDELAALAGKLGAVDARLRRDFPEFAELSAPKPLALGEAQKLLAADEALVAFVVADDAVYRFIVRSDRAEFRRIEIRRLVLEEQVLALRQNLDPAGVRSLAELRGYDAASAHELYQSLFGAAEPLLAGATRLMIVPDGVLGGLPFSVLPTRPPPGNATGFTDYRRVDWLMRRYAITVLPSAGSLRALRAFAARAQAPREPFLGFGDPDLKGRPGDARGKKLARLVSRGAVADVATVRSWTRCRTAPTSCAGSPRRSAPNRLRRRSFAPRPPRRASSRPTCRNTACSPLPRTG